MTRALSARPTVTDSSLMAKLPAVVFAGLFGMFVLMGVGLVPIDAVHNAAHDTRHAFAFPCH